MKNIGLEQPSSDTGGEDGATLLVAWEPPPHRADGCGLGPGKVVG